MRWIIAHWGANKKHIVEAVAGGLERMGHSCTWMQRDDMTVRGELVSAIAGGEFDGLLTWQRFFRMQGDLLEVVGQGKVRTVYLDFGFWPHYECVVFDTAGENAISALRGTWSDPSGRAALRIDEAAADALFQEHALKATVKDPPDIPELEAMTYPFVFVPLQRPGDSTVRFDSSVHDLGQLVRRILFLAANRFYVVVKTHPLDAELDLGVPERVEGGHVIIRRSYGGENERVCDFLLSQASLVVGINSSMLFRAILFGKPVIATGQGWYSGSGAIQEVDGLDGLHALDHGPIDWAARRRYVGACLARQLPFADMGDPEALRRVFEAIGFGIPAHTDELTAHGTPPGGTQ